MKKEIKLFLDDLRDIPEGFTTARTVEEAIYYLENFHVEILSLDHDLGEDEKGDLLPTGYDLVKYICEHDYKIKYIFIHTDNPVGRENMYQTLIGAQRRGFIDSDIKIYDYPFIKNKYTEGWGEHNERPK
ncbi:hypothetical protein HBE96_00275 [Clostridium sp. P21]|uniref:Cyclic-phosphate processing Receiver domain-containing protein n=1 Tax=Clostridium muellerianum TaxID=2716538 RepID=A0A7Y0ED00_9CLOT|nr:cyclic-phosphate processing receiver domain-containing protein [Clostridium muellerianum]NMM61162.1 hypothetical protein [Clostridium muellerianum]